MLRTTEQEILQSTQALSSHHTLPPRDDGEDEDAEDSEEQEHSSFPVKMMQQVGTFDKVVVWGHDAVPDGDDGYVRGVEEWMRVAGAVHGY